MFCTMNILPCTTRVQSNQLYEISSKRKDKCYPAYSNNERSCFKNQYQSINQHLFGTYLWGFDADELDKQLDSVFAGENTRSDSVKTHQLIQANSVETNTVEQSRSPFDFQVLAHLAEKLQAANIQLSVVIAPVSQKVRSTQISVNEDTLLKETLRVLITLDT